MSRKLAAGLIVAAMTWIAPSTAQACVGAGIYNLCNDATGGDCTKIGTWNPATLTCTLTTDLVDVDTTPDTWGLVGMPESGITLDGAGHELLGTGWPAGRWGISASVTRGDGMDRHTVRNVRVNNFGGGLIMDLQATNMVIENCEFLHTGEVRVGGDTRFPNANVRITGNHFVNTVMETSANGVNVEGNLFSREHRVVNGWDLSSWCWGLSVGGSNAVVSGNSFHEFAPLSVGASPSTVRDNGLYGDPGYSECGSGVTGANAQVFHNDFVDVPLPSTDGLATFGLPAPVGGNYYSRAQCVDLSPRDGFCDGPVQLSGGKDSVAFAVKSGWNLTTHVTLAEYNSRSATIRVAANSDLGSAAALQVVGYGPLRWNATTRQWTGNFHAATNPGWVVVAGVDGSVPAQLTVR
jgi:hypothetical protein